MNKPRITSLDPQDVPEVAEYMEVEKQLDSWKAAYPGAYEELREIIEARNTALENADKAIRAKEVSCGPFTLLHYTVHVDENALYDAVGKDEFLKIGGAIQTVQKFTVDKKAFDTAIVQKKVPASVVTAVVTHRPSFKNPKAVELP